MFFKRITTNDAKIEVFKLPEEAGVAIRGESGAFTFVTEMTREQAKALADAINAALVKQ